MSQLPLSVICGTLNPTRPNCPPNGNYEVDVDGAGVGILYSDTRTLTPCKAVTTVTITQPALTGGRWNPQAIPGFPLGVPNAADPRATSASGGVYSSLFPFPPHCWGWEGASDFRTTRYYSFEGTCLQIADTDIEFAQFDSRYLRVTADYDVTTTRRMTQRKLVFFRPDFSSGFDFSTPASDTCTDIEGPTTTVVHHTDILYSNLERHGLSETDQWNSLAFHDTDTDGVRAFAFAKGDYQDSSYYDPVLTHGVTLPGYGTFSEGYGPLHIGLGGGSLEWDVLYTFGRETVTTTNVRFTVTSAWHQFHCTTASGGPTPCECNHDCPPCQGVGSVASGRCAILCAGGSTSDTLIQGFKLTDQNGHAVTTPGWTVTPKGPCALQVCAPCLTREQVAAGNYQGPYTLVWGTSEQCFCPGQPPKYKTFTAKFYLTVDVVCPSLPTTVGRSVSYDVSGARRHVRAYSVVKADGTFDKVKVGLASDVFPLDWKDISTDVTAKRFCIRWDRQSLGSTLYALAELAGDFAGQLWMYQSDDEGFTWKKLFKVADGARPCLLIARDGRRFAFWFKDGAISQKVYDAAWNVAIDTKIAFERAADDDFNVDEWVGNNGEWQLPAWYTLSGPAQHPTGFAASDRRRFYYFNRGGQVSCYILDATGKSIMGTFVVGNLGAVDDDQIAVDETVERDGTWYVTILYRSGGKISCKSSKDGIIFA